MWHVTVRMAWHDHGWDGHVCKDPAANTYCTGSHSLLSERLAREKRTQSEKPRAKLDAAMPEYLPPCFWSSCAFADASTQVAHRHPFRNLRDTKQIDATLAPYAVYTWPFRLAMTHSSFKRHESTSRTSTRESKVLCETDHARFPDFLLPQLRQSRLRR